MDVLSQPAAFLRWKLPGRSLHPDGDTSQMAGKPDQYLPGNSERQLFNGWKW